MLYGGPSTLKRFFYFVSVVDDDIVAMAGVVRVPVSGRKYLLRAFKSKWCKRR